MTNFISRVYGSIYWGWHDFWHWIGDVFAPGRDDGIDWDDCHDETAPLATLHWSMHGKDEWRLREHMEDNEDDPLPDGLFDYVVRLGPQTSIDGKPEVSLVCSYVDIDHDTDELHDYVSGAPLTIRQARLMAEHLNHMADTMEKHA